MLFDLDTLAWCFGELGEVRASVVRDATGSIRHACALLDFRGVRADVEASFLLPRSHPFTTTLSALCERGMVEGKFSAPPDGPPTARCSLYPREGPPAFEDALGPDPIHEECRHFARVVAGEAPPDLLDGLHAVTALRMAERIRAAAW